MDIALDFVADKDVNVLEEMNKQLKFTSHNDDNCPVTEMLKFRTAKGIIVE